MYLKKRIQISTMPETDMIDQTIGVLRAGPVEEPKNQPNVQVELDVQKGYAFIAMPIGSPGRGFPLL